MKISDRIKKIRTDSSLSQADAARKYGITVGSWKKYELDSSEPGAGALKGLHDGGININWLLSGEGPMLLADLSAKSSAAPVPTSPIDYELLQNLIEMLERALSERRLVMKPANKAAAIQLMYEYCLLDEEAATPATVERFLKLVA